MSEPSIASRRLSPGARSGLALFARYATIIGLVLMIVIFSILSPDAFPTFNNFINVLNQASLATIIAGGLTLAVIVGELDLSIGYAASLHGVLVTGLIVHDKLPTALAILIVLALGALIGVVNGLIVTKLRVNSVIATLGVGTIIVGLAFAYSSGVPIVAGVPEGFLQLSLGRWLLRHTQSDHRHGGRHRAVSGSWSNGPRSARRSRRSEATRSPRALRASASTASRSSASSSRPSARR